MYAIKLRGIFFVSFGSFCLREPDAAFLGFAKFSLILRKSFFLINTSPLISISSGKLSFLIIIGISLIVLRFSVITSPILPSPLDTPTFSFLSIYVKDADIPSIFGSTL